jgi:LacI family transcriptional regulator
MKIAIQKGYKIPEEMSIIAFTDGVLSKHSIPALSTISQHALEMGKKSATMLIDKLEELVDEEKYQTEVINTTLIERDTTRS